MEHRRLGRSGMYVSEISYGNWLTHGSQVEADAATACVKEALEVGITTFDTADVYAQTKAESILGDALKGVRRESYELFTKVYWPTGPGRNDRGLSRKHIVESCNASLKRLRTDHIDLYQAHRFDHETPLDETLRAFDDLVRAGKVHYIGVSEWKAEEISRALKIADQMGLDRIVSNQPQYSALYRVIEAEVVPLCEREGVGQVVWSPIAQGVLTGKYLPGQAPPEGSRATDAAGGDKMIARWLRDDVLTAVQALTPLAADAGLTLAQLAVAWVLHNPNVSSAIVGASRPEQVRDNAAAAGKALDDDLFDAVNQVLAGVVITDPSLTKSPAQRP
ncbi:MAG: aldo/keto reductase [Frankiales bacterium]|nr:aldo/keto reductase [Frankiales bacterium]